ncbi:NFX1-type zinc finger-containing protein 1-like [Xenia sp. Carnegie-2017]|uniref:NFX1-type zinc finger-containing protein 1-like n=1 Tax=Xenia sp. Carnegie-2017 TaxID=2897299 RepID=UPI001F04D263|nr:NFX1-type zinc finger-containing protein 1-like [Xenia sp. Carnegie-2017]XP_046847642.1 NFX1-type zinc finger-containing protein 1-like [Xenia sp. Carnegie-2017]
MNTHKKKFKTIQLKAQETTQWLRGRLCPIRKDTAWFVKPFSELPDGYEKTKDVFLYPNYISKEVLPVAEGDILEFILGDRDKSRPMAIKVRVCQYSPRFQKDVIKYVRRLNMDLNSTKCKTILTQVLPCTSMWKYLGSPVFKDGPGDESVNMSYIEALIELMQLLLQHGKAYKSLQEEAMKNITRGTVFQDTEDEHLLSIPKTILSCNYTENDKFYMEEEEKFLSAELLRNICHEAIRKVPTLTHFLLPTVNALSAKIQSSSTQNFLCTLLSLNCRGDNGFVMYGCVWLELPLIPSEEELHGNLIEKDKNLTPVRLNTPYDNPEQYMDTYFRLVRAEAFSAMQHGIKDLKSSTLDLRDMNVYYNLHLAGFELQNGRFSLAVHFTPTKKVKKWEASPQLMYGNLVCISVNRKFDDLIWATVTNRDTDLLNQNQIIVIELIDENRKSMSAILNSFQTQAGFAIMVESPTYYHSLSPILKSLKEFDMENFPLQKEIVYTKASAKLPEYLREATFNTSIVFHENPTDDDSEEIYSSDSSESIDDDDRDEQQASSEENLGHRMQVKNFLKVFKNNRKTSLEKSQRRALVHALKNRIGIIQGPPGCGKTFIGVKIVQLLLSLSPKLEKPILLLTYKNHALDEFLKHMLEFCVKDDMVRIGGRSKEPRLESCKLKSLRKEIVYDKATNAEIRNTSVEIKNIEVKTKQIVKELERSSFLTYSSLVEEMEEEQLKSLIANAPWGQGGIAYNISSKKIVDKRWMESQIQNAVMQYGSIKECIQKALRSGLSKKEVVGYNCIYAFQAVISFWFPNRMELQRMKKFQSEFILQIEAEDTSSKQTKKSEDLTDGDDSGDEDYVKQLTEIRMGARAQQIDRRKDLVLFDITNTKNRNDILLSVSDYPSNMVVSSQIRSVQNMWTLNEFQKLQFLYAIMNEKTNSLSQQLNDLIDQLQKLRSRKEELEMTDEVLYLSEKKIIGVTITGASIYHDILYQIGPSVVIVEEAAEILEPSLLAALTPSIQHLILIGDHKQLRPQVDTYELCKTFQFDISMMERLIESGFPYKSLAKQNRMRPEFSALLKDIYPNLQDNLPLVLQNEPLKCIEKSMFFWSHNDPEIKDRTYSNPKEAERIIKLIKYLLCNGIQPEHITVLAAYLGQTKLLRQLIKAENIKNNQYNEQDRDNFMQVQTIDMYQGDENEYIIISLVRSNDENKIGFLKNINRRCVAQSRAKCGMYFVGNADTLRGAKDSCWSSLVSSLEDQGCLGSEIPLQCVKHSTSKYFAKDGDSIRALIAKPKLLCQQRCGDYYPHCDQHPCRLSCFPRHNHYECPVLVDDKFPGCGHDVTRKCATSITQLHCQTIETVQLDCGHNIEKKCSQNKNELKCKVMVTATFPTCGHTIEKKCHVDINLIKCLHPCKEMNSCGVHRCQKKCGEHHGHDTCDVKIDYVFPDCGHPSPKKKKCSEPITWKCRYKVPFTCKYGHEIQKECCQNDQEVICPVKPCGRLRKCGHPCENACGEDCEKGECKHCQRVYRKKIEEFHAVAKMRVNELEEKINNAHIPKFSRDELRASGSTAAEYQKVKDQVMKFIQPCHKWFPRITKIEKVTNLELEKNFETAKSKAFGDYIDTKFHGTSKEALRNIVRKGFKMPSAKPKPPNKPGMFGQGIYFATDSSKSAQDIYTKGSQTLLLCQVILGKSLTVKEADYTLNKKKLRSQNCDSVYAPRGTAVMNDEFVIFDPDQALPQYIVHYSISKDVLPPSPSIHTTESFSIKKMHPSREVNFQDPFEMYYHFAESHFRRMSANSSLQNVNITAIDIVVNKDLEEKFEATKKKFRDKGIPDKEILAYHGTDKKNIDSILKNNLQLKFARRQAYGRGNYFSEFPEVSIGYGDGLLLCRIIPGKEFVDTSSANIPSDLNSKKVVMQGFGPRGARYGASASSNTSGEMIIIENSDQILPFFVIHR